MLLIRLIIDVQLDTFVHTYVYFADVVLRVIGSLCIDCYLLEHILKNL